MNQTDSLMTSVTAVKPARPCVLRYSNLNQPRWEVFCVLNKQTIKT